jgi:hypothetical protein
MRKTMTVLVLVALVLISSVAQAATPSKYLDAKGQLAGALEVKVVHGGFAGYTGSFIVIYPDGNWQTGSTMNDQKTPGKLGKLVKGNLEKLVKDLETYDLAGLTNFGQMQVNPQLVTISFGKQIVTLRPGPQPGVSAADDAKIRDRYRKIIDAVKAAIQPAK